MHDNRTKPNHYFCPPYCVAFYLHLHTCVETFVIFFFFFLFPFLSLALLSEQNLTAHSFTAIDDCLAMHARWEKKTTSAVQSSTNFQVLYKNERKKELVFNYTIRNSIEFNSMKDVFFPKRLLHISSVLQFVIQLKMNFQPEF